ncbi:hypothetical protein JG688_00006075 [Phytophthora aleatoria]|uniref:HTH CENPB-type domain-containing protein n=1 Tax=Phytophthora aleatoria TaxID=2496075 RepID=A0A8J5IR50_9STRA|nr:hypothetical protein JG688_00006075 [Phytophthora aleatoria]
MDILEWLIALRSHGVPVSAEMIELEAFEVAALYNVPRSIFAATPTWIASYLSRYSLSLRAKTRQGQTTPEDSDIVAKAFSATVRRRIAEERTTKVYNADQTAIFYEYVSKRTVDRRGAKCNSQHAIAALLATTQRLLRRGSRSGALGFEREYMEICWSIDKAPGYKEALTPQTKATKAKNR